MNNVILCVTIILGAALSIEAACPHLACPLGLAFGDQVFTTTYDYNGETCNACPTILRADHAVSDDGCPVVPCSRIGLKPGCARQTTFVYNGQSCPGCQVEAC